MSNTSAINQKIWSMATVLMNDGVSNSDYLEQLTYLLFLKMADEFSKPPYNYGIKIPKECRWDTLITKDGISLFDHYKYILNTLSKQSGILQQIYAASQNKISNPAMLKRVINMINAEKWSNMSDDVKGDIYEGLLQKIAEDTKSGAGQYFTPRALINTIVKCVDPKPGKTIADPCCGSGGFLLAAKSYINDKYNIDLNVEQKEFLKRKTFYGWEIVQSTYRLCLMNLFLHNIGDFDGDLPVSRNDALLSDPGDRFDYILTNPPFGTKSSITFTNKQGKQEKENLKYNRQDFWITSSNKQLNFVQHINTILKENGTAAVVVPDNVLFEEKGGADIVRKKLLESNDLHTILRLPKSIFYAKGISANVIFFDKRRGSPTRQTEEVWIYDYRTGIKHTLVQNPLKESDLDDFVKCYNPSNPQKRKETYDPKTNPEGRWRKYSIEEILSRDKTSLDITWITSNDDEIEHSLDELLDMIKEKTSSITTAVDNLSKLIKEPIK